MKKYKLYPLFCRRRFLKKFLLKYKRSNAPNTPHFIIPAKGPPGLRGFGGWAVNPKAGGGVVLTKNDPTPLKSVKNKLIKSLVRAVWGGFGGPSFPF